MDRLSELLSVWHTYRAPAILLVVVLFAIFRVVHHLTKSHGGADCLPPASPLPVFVDGGKVTKPSRANQPAQKPLKTDQRKDIVGTDGNSPRKPTPRKVVGTKLHKQTRKATNLPNAAVERIQPLIFFSSPGGSTEEAAARVTADLNDWIEQRTPAKGGSATVLKAELHDLSYVELDDYFTAPPKSRPDTQYFYLVVIPTYNIDTVLRIFLDHLRETHHDFRIDTAPLANLLGYSVFGFGDAEEWPTEEEGFCSQAREVDRWLAKLTGRKRAYPLGLGDVKGEADERMKEWRVGVQEAISDISHGRGLGEGVPGSGDAVESDEEDLDDEDVDENPESAAPTKARRKKKAAVDDLEDIGNVLRSQSDSASNEPRTSKDPLLVDFTTYGESTGAPVSVDLKEMVPKSSPTYATLTKQGYTIVGSHSGVKICRWTKSALRGRGSCYKYTFYGIQSHLCMEATPSLSCSNKCVFCWRHGTNPVGTTWRWQVDPPDKIFAGMTEGHYRKIKVLKGVPGVRAERFAEAMRIKHCALSLVGEPIFYPHINEFLALVHQARISSFLVCNAQHPDELAALDRVTQLYVSIDASNAESLRRIDRPLHRDFWSRFTRCLDILRERRFEQRTVFRLTLVKGFNIDEESEGYADLVQRALPCFIEVKGVTYCGTSASSTVGLTMQNVPWYHEVCAFARALDAALARRGLRYGIATEHAHSCCVLLASERFKRDGQWCTRIDYDKFFDCLDRGEPFGPEDYMGEPTPEWALWGNGGFDPRDERWYRKNRKVTELPASAR